MIKTESNYSKTVDRLMENQVYINQQMISFRDMGLTEEQVKK